MRRAPRILGGGCWERWEPFSCTLEECCRSRVRRAGGLAPRARVERRTRNLVASGDTGYSENILVESKNGFGSLQALLQAEVNYIASLPDQFGYAPTDTTVCGNHPAKYLSYTYTSPSGEPVTAEVVIAVFGTTGYMARYSKTISQWADASAERSLTTLCGRAASH